MIISITVIILILIGFLMFLIARNLIFNWILSIKSKNIPLGINSLNFLNVISLFLAVLSVGFTISNDLVNKINKHSQENGTLYLIIFMFILVLVFYRMNTKNDKINSLERQLETETKELWKKYSELNEFYREKTLIDGLERFVNSTTHVLSVQRYKYKMYKTKGFLTIVLNGDHSYIKEGEDLNTISQAYFKFSLKDIKELTKAISHIRNSERTGNYEDDSYIELIKLYTVWGNELVNKTINEYRDTDSLKYQLLKIIQDLIENVFDDGTSLGLKFSEEQINLLDGRKSGIDIALFLLKKFIDYKSEFDTFNYKGASDSKKFRMYSNVEVLNNIGEQFIFVLAHYADITWSERMQQKKVEEDTTKFICLLQSDMYFIH